VGVTVGVNVGHDASLDHDAGIGRSVSVGCAVGIDATVLDGMMEGMATIVAVSTVDICAPSVAGSIAVVVSSTNAA
jgi:hypothetical protein